MSRRNSNRQTYNSNPKMKPGAKRRLVIMIISVVLMVFSVVQVYHLARYTFGMKVSQDDIKVYRWVYMLLEGDTTTEE